MRGSTLIREKELLFGRLCLGGVGFRVFPAEAFDAAGGIEQLLLASEEGMAVRANFYADVALVSRTGNKIVAAGAVHPHLVITRMDCRFHVLFG